MRPFSRVISRIVPAKALTKLAFFSLSRRRFALADHVLGFGLLGRPRQFRLRELHALGAHNSGRYEEALSRWRIVEQLRPDFPMALCGVAANARELGRLNEAAAAIDAALARFPDDFVVISEAARVFDSRRDYAASAECSARTLGFPMLPDICIRVAAASLLRVGRFEEAADALSRVAGGSTARDKARLWFEVAAMMISPGQPGFDRFFEDAFERFGQEAHALPQAAEWTNDPAAFREPLVGVLARHPRDAEARESYVRVLIRCDLLADAERELARLDWPSDTTPVLLRSLLRVRTGDIGAAASYLTKFAAAKPRDEAAQALIERTRAIADLTSETTEPSARPATTAPGKEDDTRNLMLRFESLGSDCSFGMVQRRYGAEPLGLLRWTETNLDMLTRALEARFEGIGRPENTELFVGGGGEIYVRDKKWNLVMHTFIRESEVSMAALFPKMCRRFVFLSNKLVGDIRDGGKVLVFTSAAAGVDALVKLQEVVQTIGPSRILSIQQKANGSGGEGYETKELRPGLFVGFVSNITYLNGDEEPAEWVSLCGEVETMRDRAPRPAAPSRTSGQASETARAAA